MSLNSKQEMLAAGSILSHRILGKLPIVMFVNNLSKKSQVVFSNILKHVGPYKDPVTRAGL